MSFMSKIKSVQEYVSNNKAQLAMRVSSIATSGYVLARTYKDPVGSASLVTAWMGGFMAGTIATSATNVAGMTNVSECDGGMAGAAAAVIVHEAFAHGRVYMTRNAGVIVDSAEFIGDTVADSAGMIA